MCWGKVAVLALRPIRSALVKSESWLVSSFDWRYAVIEVRHHYLRPRITIERMDAGENKIIDAADGIHVGAGVEFHAFELFRCHEKDRAKD